MKLIAAITITIALLPSLALAQPLPQPKPPGPGGSCPHGYTSSGSFCVPGAGAQEAIPVPPNGTCPWGWTHSGSYCLRSGDSRRDSRGAPPGFTSPIAAEIWGGLNPTLYSFGRICGVRVEA